MAALIRLALSAILRGMLTADRPEKRRQATRGSQPATVVRRRSSLVRSVAFAVEFNGSGAVEKARREVMAEEMKEGNG